MGAAGNALGGQLCPQSGMHARNDDIERQHGELVSTCSPKASRRARCFVVLARWTPWSSSEAVIAAIAAASSPCSSSTVSRPNRSRSMAIKTLASISMAMEKAEGVADVW